MDSIIVPRIPGEVRKKCQDLAWAPADGHLVYVDPSRLSGNCMGGLTFIEVHRGGGEAWIGAQCPCCRVCFVSMRPRE